MQGSFDCELRVFTQDAIKRITGKEYTMNNVTRDHIAYMHMLSISHVLDLLACMYVQLSIVKNESSSILQANCQLANTIINAKPSATIAQAVWHSITHPTSSLISHTSIAKIEGVAFSLGHLQSLESQSGLYNTICNHLTTHSKHNLW